jgi:hypothetical protein
MTYPGFFVFFDNMENPVFLTKNSSSIHLHRYVNILYTKKICYNKTIRKKRKAAVFF